MADYISQYTGGQIDSAVGRALPGGTLEQLIAAKAAGGFGFGDAINAVSTWQNTEAELEANLDALAATMKNQTAINIRFACGETLYNLGNFYGIFYISNNVTAGSMGYGVRAVDPGNGLVVQKRCRNSVWTPFEFENPPMQLGVEYRTTERYLGKPVYKMAFNFGALPNSTEKTVNHNIANVSDMISCIGTANGAVINGNANFPDCFANTGFVRITTKVDVSSSTAVTILKYTKTTD